jgi:predicted transposase YbfD/YdcC
LEVRRLWVKKWAAEVVREQLGVPNCRSLIRLDKEIRRKGKEPTVETRYYMSSLDPDHVSAAQFQDYILGHWEVENCLHLAKDREYEEDKHVVRRGGWGEAWTVLTNIAVSLVNLLRQKERTLRAVRERCNAYPASAARILGWKT